MTLVTLFCILGVAVILGVLYVIFCHNTNLLNFIVKLLAPTACLLLALISANLSSSFGGYTTFIAMGLAITIAVNAFQCVKQKDLKKSETLFLGSINALTILCFAVAGIVIANFNVLGLACGLLLGLGTGFLVSIFRKMNLAEGAVTIINTAIAGLMFGQGIVLFLSHVNIIGAVLYFISAILTLSQLILSVFIKENKAMQIISNTMRILSLITIALSIYFMI